MLPAEHECLTEERRILDMARGFEGRMASVDIVLLEMERRDDFFDGTIRIGRVLDLLKRSRVQEGFERRVVAGAPQQIEERAADLVECLLCTLV